MCWCRNVPRKATPEKVSLGLGLDVEQLRWCGG
jgi:hypothetical protein